MAVFATIVIAFVVLITLITVVISIGNRTIVAEMEYDLQEALAAIDAARRFYARQSMYHLSGKDYANQKMGVTK
ncbi:putative GNAT N-acetyltransferase [Erwinia phage pEa_SNUABM_5]|uniref:Putative GNAT N-acetyltransferase n=1 Tax=Erwinia phage pEa_SNUABM_5 TaxID=2797313 RepID=A0A7T8IWA6_9CAUD|nr:putative GNAT N-acetyltransferase [Erwinia phage pEa_SNUABM_5]QQO90409.1 putative GNAT N-acetyltransferase [Erwinia phage pEa_SNUABM_5]